MSPNDRECYPRCMVNYYFGKIHRILYDSKSNKNYIKEDCIKIADILLEYKLKYNKNLYGKLEICSVQKETFKIIGNEYSKRHLNNVLATIKENEDTETIFRRFYVFGMSGKDELDNVVFENYYKTDIVGYKIPFLENPFELYRDKYYMSIEDYINIFNVVETVYMLDFLMRKIKYHKGYVNKRIFNYIETLSKIIYHKLEKQNAEAIVCPETKLFYGAELWNYIGKPKYELTENEKESLLNTLNDINNLLYPFKDKYNEND